MKEKTKLLNAVQSRPIQPHILQDRNWVTNAQAEYAKELIKCGGYAEFGESREHYQEMKVVTPQQFVKRACDIAEEAYKEFERRKWLIEVPFYDECVAALEHEVVPTGFTKKVA